MSGARLGLVIYRVDDLNAAEAFYRDVVGLKPKFRDGDEWAAFNGDSVTFALEKQPKIGAKGQEAQAAVAAFRVSGLEEFARELNRRGGSPGPIETGPHERRFSVADPTGNRVVFYEPAPPPAAQ